MFDFILNHFLQFCQFLLFVLSSFEDTNKQLRIVFE